LVGVKAFFFFVKD